LALQPPIAAKFNAAKLERLRETSNYFEADFRAMARVTGLEPATSGVTGRRSNQLSYTRIRSAREPAAQGG
jgi:hypothetical protein